MATATVPTKSVKKKAGLAFWMQRVLEECDRASIAFAPDPVHDLRVALRRCCSMADGIAAIDPDRAWKDMKKAGKLLFRRLGDLRQNRTGFFTLGRSDLRIAESLRSLARRRSSHGFS